MGKMILFQGDSITDAGRRSQYESCGSSGTELGIGYPRLVASRLWAEEPEKKWQFINRAVSGNRSVDLYARWKIDAVNLKPDIISILVGVNDTWHEFDCQNGVEIPRYEEFYRRLLEWSLREKPKVKFMLLEPYVLPSHIVTKAWLKEIDARREVVQRIALDYPRAAVFVPLQERFQKAAKRAPVSHWLVDGVHPAPAGHWLIADAWMEGFRRLTGKENSACRP